MASVSSVWTSIGLLVFFGGCTHTQFRKSSVRHATTVADVHTQQVLDNLAKFANNPGALPHFAYPAGGSSQITDDLRVSPSFNFSPHRLTAWALGFQGSRNDRQTYTMQPINDPRKLELMRCAYQHVVRGYCSCGGEGECPNCQYRFNDFYLGKELPGKTPKKTYEGNDVYALFDDPQSPMYLEVYKTKNQFDETEYRYVDTGDIIDSSLIESAKATKQLKQLHVDNSVREHTTRTGKVTSDCLSTCWFKSGKGCNLPKCNPCCLVGQHCGTYVIVPECHRDELTKLTLVILDIALNDPAELPAKPTRKVTALLDSSGNIATTRRDAVYRVEQTIPVSSKASTVQKFRNSEREVIIQAADDLSSEAHKAIDVMVESLSREGGNKRIAATLQGLNTLTDSQLMLKLQSPSDAADDLNALRKEGSIYDTLLSHIQSDIERAESLRAQALSIPVEMTDSESPEYDEPEPIQNRTDTPGTNLLLNQLRLDALTPGSRQQ